MKLWRLFRSIEGWAWVGCALAWVGLARDWAFLRGPDEWRWLRRAPGTLAGRTVPAALAFAAAGALCGWVLFSESKRLRPALPWLRPLALLAGSLVVQWAVLYLDNAQPLIPLLCKTVSPETGGYFNVAARIGDVGAFVRDYPRLMPGFELHPSTHPPGIVLMFWALRHWLQGAPALASRIAQALRGIDCKWVSLAGWSDPQLGSAVLQMATPIAAALSILPFAALARRLAPPAAARWAQLCFLFSPGIVLWATRWNQVYVLLCAAGLYWLHRGLQSGRLRWMAAAGGTVGIATFLDFANLALIPLMAAYAVFHLYELQRLAPGRERRAPLVGGLLPGLGAWLASAACPWLIASRLGLNVWATFSVGMSQHQGQNRTYWLWVPYDLWDFFLFLGVVGSIGAGLALLRARSPAKRGRAATLAFWVTLIALDALGVVRGQSARIWMFLVPVAHWAGITALQGRSDRRNAVLLGAQATYCLILAVFLRPVVAPGF